MYSTNNNNKMNQSFDNHLLVLLSSFIMSHTQQSSTTNNVFWRTLCYDSIIEQLDEYKQEDGVHIILFNNLLGIILSCIKKPDLIKLKNYYNLICNCKSKCRFVFPDHSEKEQQVCKKRNTAIFLQFMETLNSRTYAEVTQFYGHPYNNAILNAKFGYTPRPINLVRKSKEIMTILMALTPCIRQQQCNIHCLMFVLCYLGPGLTHSFLEQRLYDFAVRKYQNGLYIEIK